MIPAAPATVVDSVATDTSSVINAKVGQTFLVGLDANPSTGYAWSLTQGDGSPFFESLGSAYLKPSNGMPGAGGKQLLLFRAVRSGSTDLTLRYVRPFDQSSNNTAKQMTFHVVVGP